MDKEKFLDALYELKEDYEDAICEVQEHMRENGESLNCSNNADHMKQLLSGICKVQEYIKMAEYGDRESYRGGYGYDSGSTRGMRGGSRDVNNGMNGGGGSTRRGRSPVTGRYRSYDDGGDQNMRQQVQDFINQIQDRQMRMDMQRALDNTGNN